MLDKKNLREIMDLKRKNIINKKEKDSFIKDRLLNFINNFSYTVNNKKTKIFSYVSIGCEVDTREIIDYYMNNEKNKKEIYIPYTSNEINLTPLKDTDSLKADKFGNIPNLENREKYFGDIDITIVPMLAFNNNLYRLGYGGGYYDKFLQKYKTFTIGLAYDEQLSSEIEIEKHDIKLDIIITPLKILRSANESNNRQV